MAKKRILIIDDDAELGEELAEILEAEGYSADTASEGPKGIDLIRKTRYDVFLFDFKIMGMTGITLLKEIRGKDPEAAVFFISGKPDLEALLEAEGLLRAVTGIIEKPFEPLLLLEKIRSCLRP